MGNWFGKKSDSNNTPWPGGMNNRSPESNRIARRATIFVLSAVLVAWVMSGMFVLREHQRAVVLRLGKFHRVASAGFNLSLPYPIETHEILPLAESGSVVIGDVTPAPESGLRDAEIRTADGYIVQVSLLAQYRVRDMGQFFLTQANDVEYQLKQAGASALRESLANMELTSIIASKPEQIISRVRPQLQSLLDATQSGIEITSLSAGADAVRVPAALNAVYANVEKARQDKERIAHQAATYASQTLSNTEQEVAAMRSDAEAYKAAVVAEAQSESERFAVIFPEYKKEPQATRDRLYQDTLQQVFSHANKVVVDSSVGQPIYVQIQQPGQTGTDSSSAAELSNGDSQKTHAGAASAPVSAQSAAVVAASSENVVDARSRNPVRLRER